MHISTLIVCEIWNGDAIVRVMGAPDIEQFLFFNKLPAEFVRKGLPQSTEETTEGSSQETWRILTLKEATDIGLLERRKHGSLTEMSWRYTGSFVHRIFRRIAGLRAPTSGVHEDDCGGAPPSATIIQTVEISPTAPLGVSSVFRRKRSSLADLERASTTSEGIKSLPLKAQESDELRLPSSDSEPEENGADNHNKAAPNISLNLGVMTKPWELYIAAVFGVFVQLGVLVIAGLATYHPRWKFRKQGLTVRDYAYRNYLPLLIS